MQLQIIDNKDIDRRKWEALVKSDPYGFPYAASWYLDIVSPKWKALIFEDYKFALALPTNKKYGISYVFPPSFTQQIGLIGEGDPSESILKQMIAYAAEHFKYLEFNLNKNNKLEGEIENYKYKWRRNLELDLSGSYDNIFSNFHKNTKRNIKKSKESGLIIEKTDNYDAMISTFIDGKAKNIKGRDLDYTLLTKLIEKGNEINAVEIYSVKKDSVFLGSALFINHLKRKVFLFSAINEMGRSHRAMFSLIDHIIEKNANSDIILDFEGSDDDKLASFYQRFGAKETLYLHLKINQLPFFIKWLKG